MATPAEHFEAAFDAYLTNSGYEENRSYAECQAFITACRKLLILLPTRAITGARAQVEMNVPLVEKAIAKAQSWALANQPAGRLGSGGTREYFMADDFDGR